jgi:hypothetical protein
VRSLRSETVGDQVVELGYYEGNKKYGVAPYCIGLHGAGEPASDSGCACPVEDLLKMTSRAVADAAFRKVVDALKAAAT